MPGPPLTESLGPFRRWVETVSGPPPGTYTTKGYYSAKTVLPIGMTVAADKSIAKLVADCVGGELLMLQWLPRRDSSAPEKPHLLSKTWACICVLADRNGRLVYRGFKGSDLDKITAAAGIDMGGPEAQASGNPAVHARMRAMHILDDHATWTAAASR